jgi:hypothetical protein
MNSLISPEDVIASTREWVEKAVLGLNLCPFAGHPWRADQVRLVVSKASSEEQLAAELVDEMLALVDADPVECETTLLIHPYVLSDFLDYNDFLGVADELLERLSLEGTLQVASFHPDYLFGDLEPDDPAHATNRSPYPMLHLLREASIEAATAKIVNTDAIYQRNIATMRELGVDGLSALLKR